LSTPDFIEEQLSPGEKVKSIIVQSKFVIFRETLAFTNRRLIIYRSGFLYRITEDHPYETITSIRAENSRPFECLIAFLVSLIAIAFYYARIDLTWLFPTAWPTTVYFSVISGIGSSLVVAYYIYRGNGKLKAYVAGGILLAIIAGLWFYLHYVLPPLSQILLGFLATNPFYLANSILFDELVNYIFSKIASDTAVIISTLYGIITLICFIVRLNFVLLTFGEGWDVVTFHPYNAEIIKTVRAALKQ
jgi:hypothetical protein